MDKKISYFYAVLAVFFWGSTASIGKLVLKNLDNYQVLFYVSLVASITLFFIVLFQRKLNIIKNYKWEDYRRFAYMGFVGIFLYYVFFYKALKLVQAQEAFVVNYTWPIWVVVFAMILMKEKLSVKKLIAIFLGFVGVYIVVTKGEIFSFLITNIRGDLFALAGAVFYGFFSVMGKKHNDDKTTSMMFYYWFAFIFISILTLIVSEVPKITIYEFAGLAWLGIFPSSLAFVFWFLALKYGDTAKMSNIIFLTPFLSLVYIYFLLGEHILFSSVVGLLFIVFGIVLQSFDKI